MPQVPTILFIKSTIFRAISTYFHRVSTKCFRLPTNIDVLSTMSQVPTILFIESTIFRAISTYLHQIGRASCRDNAWTAEREDGGRRRVGIHTVSATGV